MESVAFPEIRPFILDTAFNPPAPLLLPYPISISTLKKRVYFADEQGFNLLGMFQNPMMLMMLVAGGMAIGMPMLMVSRVLCIFHDFSVSSWLFPQKNMDPEVVKQVQQNQQKFAAMQSSMQTLDFGGSVPHSRSSPVVFLTLSLAFPR